MSKRISTIEECVLSWDIFTALPFFPALPWLPFAPGEPYTIQEIKQTFKINPRHQVKFQFVKLINNSKRKHKRNHEREGVCTPRYRIVLIFMNFNFDIPVSYKLYFQNYIDCSVSQALLARVLQDQLS